jgi:Flp pilus assembly protein TadG
MTPLATRSRHNCLTPGASSTARSGAVAAEFALACPLMVLLTLACADFGRISHFYEVVANAARVGAETGASQQFTDFSRPAWETRIQQAVVDEMQSLPDFNANDMTYELSVTELADDVAQVVVEVSYPFRTTVDWAGLSTETTLHKRVEYRQFR